MGDIKAVRWVGSSRDDLKEFPDEVQQVMGFALYEAQVGRKARSAKPFSGVPGGMEIVDNFDTNTYRSVYTVEFSSAIYVLHCFQKKSKKGKQTPQLDVNLIKRRFKSAQEHHKATEAT